MTDQVEWRETPSGAVPVSTRFGDPYYSLEDGLSETRHVFLDGNDLPARLREGFHIAELGFGTGLNLLAVAALGQPLRFTSFEAFPLSRAETEAAVMAFPALIQLAHELLAQWDTAMGGTQVMVGPVSLQIIRGDVAETLGQRHFRADAWFLDGFSPAKNPEMWSSQVLAEVFRLTAPGGTFATYTAAGDVRRALEAAGFAVERIPGFGRKRHMSRGTKR